MTKDPVCGMDIDEKTAAGRSEYQGKVYYFCAPGCLKAFVQKPEEYLRAQKIKRDRTAGNGELPRDCH